ncbi:DMT family transporter [Flavobacterium sp. UMI-01]|uniref:DMT family transporter n=1 Tax=Flavobacterium sp. UMI-01 TaxID=1441053 RepID=UPI001C7D0FF9|nr:DMT family transporter [Flavobacterium sp. UMI-01]GIZ08552.1 permease [Flavobacterium sp. UMI-01]
MFKNSVFKGVLLVSIGASSYGVLATFVKIAYNEGYTTAEVSSSQFLLGIIGLLLISFFQKYIFKKSVPKPSSSNILKLMLAGTSMGFTSVFYYLSVIYIPVSIGIVLLMQTVWMAVVLEMILLKKWPSLQKITAVGIVLLGTLLATNIIENQFQMDWRGVLFGLLAATSFTTTMFTANRIVTTLPTVQRSLYMLIGGAIIVLLFGLFYQDTAYDFSIFYKWGLVLSLFGTIIPPLLLNAGFPLTGIGLGSIVSSIELPVSVFMAYLLLNESVTWLQWSGIILILFAIFLMNSNKK